MKFESKYGLGEVCGYNEDARRGDKKMEDVLVKIISITFDYDGQVGYMVEHIGNQFGVQRFHAVGEMLHGDPDFDQDTGSYPPEKL